MVFRNILSRPQAIIANLITGRSVNTAGHMTHLFMNEEYQVRNAEKSRAKTSNQLHF